MGNVQMEASQIRYKGQYRNVQEALENGGGGGGGTTVVANPSGAATADLSKLQVGESIYGIPATAAKIAYSNTDSGLTADDVQAAIDELSGAIPGVATTSAPGIVQPDGTSITIADGVISAAGGSGSGETYSEIETKIGTWLGSDLYRKVYNFGALPSDIIKSLDSGLNNILIRSIYGIAWNANQAIPLPSLTSGGVPRALYYDYTENKIVFASNTGTSSYTNCYVVLEYTKNS